MIVLRLSHDPGHQEQVRLKFLLEAFVLLVLDHMLFTPSIFYAELDFWVVTPSHPQKRIAREVDQIHHGERHQRNSQYLVEGEA